MSPSKKSGANWGNRLFAILGLIVVFSMVMALVVSAFQPGI